MFRLNMIYLLDTTKESKEIAKIISQAYDLPPPTTQPFYQNDCCKDLLDPTTLLFVGCLSGHASSSAVNFAKYFSKQFGKKFAPTMFTGIKNIYFLTQDYSLCFSNQAAFMQKIADELHNVGFKNVMVHAFTIPEALNSDNFGLRFEVHGPSLITHLNRTARKNIVSAYYLSKDHMKELTSLEENPHANHALIQEIQQMRFYIAYKESPFAVLNFPQHCFIPHENFSQRQIRIAEHPVGQDLQDEAQEQHNLYQKLYSMKYSYPLKAKHKIELFAEKILHLPAHQWRQHLNGERKNLLHLKVLHKNDALNKLLKKHEIKEKTVVVKKSSIKKISPPLTLLAAPKPTSNEIKRPSIKKISSPLTLLVPPKPTPEEITIEKAKQKVQILIQSLTKEIGELRESVCCLNLFTHYEIETKKQKLSALTNLNFTNIHNLCLSAGDALLKSRVVRSKKSARTQDLLLGLLNLPYKKLGQNV